MSAVALGGSAGFSKPKALKVDGSVVEVDTGDLDGDGRADLLAAVNKAPGLRIYLGKQSGFKSPKGYPTGDSGASGVAVGRFNGDKRPDVAVSQFNPAAIQIFYSRSNGKLRRGPVAPLDSNAGDLRSADIDGDGRTDLIFPTLLGGVTVMLQTKHGFAPPVTYAITPGGDFGPRMAVGKLNRDKLPDVVTYDSAGQISTLLSKGDGTLRAYKTLQTGTTNQEVNGGLSVGDLNGDGKGDLVYASGDDAHLFVYPGKGDGTYKAPSVDRSAGAFPTDVGVADVDGDGELDAVLANRDGDPNTIPYLFKGKGDGTFKSRADQLPRATGESYALELARLDGDKRLDMILGGFKFLNTYRGKR